MAPWQSEAQGLYFNPERPCVFFPNGPDDFEATEPAVMAPPILSTGQLPKHVWDLTLLCPHQGSSMKGK